MNNNNDDRKLTKQQIEASFLFDAISHKTSIKGRAIFPVICNFKKRFGYALCAEIFQNIPDMSMRTRNDFVSYVEKALQNEYLRRNPQDRNNTLLDLSKALGR